MAVTLPPLTPAQRLILFILPLQHTMRDLGSQRMTHTLGKPALSLCNKQAAHGLQDIN